MLSGHLFLCIEFLHKLGHMGSSSASFLAWIDPPASYYLSYSYTPYRQLQYLPTPVFHLSNVEQDDQAIIEPDVVSPNNTLKMGLKMKWEKFGII